MGSLSGTETACPVRGLAEGAGAPLTITDPLYVPHRKRLVCTYVTNDEGVRELQLDYGLKEVSFDEEHLFAFGEQIGKVASFTGELAMTWGPGYAWEELQPLLESLLEEGILVRGEGNDDLKMGGLVPSLLPPSQCPVPRFWTDGCEALTRELAGYPVELGNLEVSMQLHRIAHIAMDADDRQVGEGNVYPAPLRVDRETEWRTCQYSGSRYRDRLPMNVTALKAMVKYWKPIMTTILHVRSELQNRLGPPARPPWTIGELHTFACVVLGLPAFVLMEHGGRSPQQALDPVLSSMFRITDGIRMTAYDMMFSIEHTLDVNLPMSASGLYEYAEKYAALIGDTGVCAGPEHLIREFLGTAIEGTYSENVLGRELPPQVQHIVDQLPAAIDYGLYGMQVTALVASIWLPMSEAIESLLAVLTVDAAQTDARCLRLREQLLDGWDKLEKLQHNRAYDREVHWIAYRDAYERSHRLTQPAVGPAKLDDAVAPRPADALHARAAEQLRGMLASYPASLVEPMIEIVLKYLRQEQNMLAVAAALQVEINRVLDRAPASRPPNIHDALTMFAYGGRDDWFPHLFKTLDQALGIRIEHTADEIHITERGVEQPAAPLPNPTLDHAVASAR
jgi:hypothetical protein